MLTQEQVPSIVKRVRELLDEDAEQRKAHLAVNDEETKLDDDWLYVCVEPTVSGERASDYADLMSDVEKALQRDGIENVILIPVIPD